VFAQDFQPIDKIEMKRAMEEVKRAKQDLLAHKDLLAEVPHAMSLAKEAVDHAAFAMNKPFFYQAGPRVGGGPLTEEEELKLLAIDGLMQTDPERAIPLIDKLLQNQQASMRLRFRALQALANNNSTKAREIVARVAKDGSNPDLQSRALQLLGSRDRGQNKELLAEIYVSSTNTEVKRQVLRALSHQGDAKQLIALARKETNPELKRDALRYLSNMKGEEVTAYLTELLEK
jgi:HEAT repeat protein